MKHKQVLFLFLFLFSKAFSSNTILLSDSTKVSLITCDEGADLYSAFGHSAVRFTDSLNGFDVVFNYGAFNFDEPNFYWHFLQGRSTFYLVIERMPDFMQGYIEENRRVVETPLNLTKKQQQKIFDYLMWNAELENRGYHYDFFFNNCATKIRDVFESKLGYSFLLDYKSSELTKGFSMRTLLDTKLHNRPWVRLSFYFILGIPSDQVATPCKQMYLPSYLHIAFKKGTIHGSNLCKPDQLLLDGTASAQALHFYSQPVFVITFTLLLLLCSLLIKNKIFVQISSVLLLLSTGAVGCFLWYLWLGTEFQSSYQNLNLLWANPFNIIIGLFVLPMNNKWIWIYMKCFGIYLLLLSPVCFILPQKMYFGLPIWLALAGIFFILCSKKISEPT